VFHAYTGEQGINPAVAHDREWKKIRKWTQTEFAEGRENRTLITFNEPVNTRGLKLEIIRSIGGGAVAMLRTVQVYQNLGDNPVPEVEETKVEPVFTIPFDVPLDGTMSLIINDENGSRVANVQARVPRSTGPLKEGWNLKDTTGALVQPGTYSYTALFLPELSVKFQMSPYSNVQMHSDNTPWSNGNSGSGNWLADHSGNSSVTYGGGKMYFGAGVAESGQALAETDLNGVKEWGHHNFVAWTGPGFMTFGQGTLYAASRAHWNLTDHIWTVNQADKSVKTLLASKGNNRRIRGISGIAYRNGEVYLSINANADWMANAADVGDVDAELNLPKYKVRDKEDRYDADTRDDFKRLFRLTANPSGQSNSDNKPGLTYLESTDLPGSRNHILLTFKQPVHIGSLVFPFPQGGYQMQIKALKAEGAYPPNPNRNKDWVDILRSNEGTDWQVVAAPEGLSTRALCITFRKSEDDLFDAMEESGDGADDLDLGFFDEGPSNDMFGDSIPWKAYLDGMKILRRRYEAAVEGLTVRVNSGEINDKGEWNAMRKTPIDETYPGIYMMQWDKEQSLRGLAIKEIDGKRTEIDVYTGPDGEIPLVGDQYWETIADYEQSRREYYIPSPSMNMHARYMDGYVDFGKEVKTRAVRLRVVEQWSTSPPRALGVRKDRGGTKLDLTRCRIYGVAALRYLGGEVPVDSLTFSRMEVYNADNGKLLREFSAPALGKVTVDANGILYAVANNQIARLEKDDSWTPLTDDLITPQGITTDKAGNIYVFDGNFDRKQVRVYDPSGKFLRTIGKAGGYRQGPFDSEYLTPAGRSVDTDMAMDSNGKLWITEGKKILKRISRWDQDGTWEADYYGNTEYGGGGVLDITDKRRVFYSSEDATLEFGLDWKTGATKLNAIAWMGDSPGGEYVIPIEDRKYMVTRPMFGMQACGFVYLYEGESGLRRVAAVGAVTDFKPLKAPEFYEKIANRPLMGLLFMWSDLNGDGNPQPNEVTFIEGKANHQRGQVSWFDEELGIQSTGVRFEVERFLPDGVPVYRVVDTPKFNLFTRRMTPELSLTFNQQDKWKSPFYNSMVDAQGNKLWAWETEGKGVHAYYKAGPLTPRQVVAEFDVIGTSRDNPGELGDIFVTNSNVGKLHIWTYDGILAGSLFKDVRNRERESPPAVKPKIGEIEMNNTSMGQEHFSGWFGRSREDGKYYVVAGHNYIGVSEVLGLDQARRVTGTVNVTPEDIRMTREQEALEASREAYADAKVYQCPIGDDKTVDGYLSDWQEEFIHPENYPDAEFAMHVGPENLYLAYRAPFGMMGPLLNQGGSGWQRYFKTGGAVDIMLGTDPDAKSDRLGPVKGDLRLLITRTPKGPTAVMYQPTVEHPDPSEAWQAKTMVFTTDFDRVVELKDANIKYRKSEDKVTWSLEVSVPLASLGLYPEKRQRLKFDFGFLKTNQAGNEVMQRIYWSNKATSILSDVAAEASLEPAQWGHVIFHNQGDNVGGLPLITSDILDGTKAEEEFTEEDLMDLLEN